MMRVGVLASGSGSNFEALVTALNVAGSAARVEILLCNVPGAKALERAARLGVEGVLLPHAGLSREAYDQSLVTALQARAIDLVCLAGYMRLVTPTFLRAFPQRVVNVHPALLPSFPGLHGARQALEYGVKVTGCTVHFVDEGTDTGPIIAQSVVPVLETDDEAALSKRIQVEEHWLFPAVVRAIAQGTVSHSGRRVHVTGALT